MVADTQWGRQMANAVGMVSSPLSGPRVLTLVSTVGMRLITVVTTVIVPITGPVLRDAAPAVALKLGAGAGVAATSLVTVVPTIIVWGEGRRGEARRRSAAQPFL